MKIYFKILILFIFLILSLSIFNYFSYCSDDINLNLSTNNMTSENTNSSANQLDDSKANSSNSTIVKTASVVNDTFLTPTNILNILLIVIGFVIVLLGIAILIRFKQV